MRDRNQVLRQTQERLEKLRQRSLELAERTQQLACADPPSGSTAEEVRRAQERAEWARINAQGARERATQALLQSAVAHEAAADRHDQLAASGVGDADSHRRRAVEHREMSAVDRRAAVLEEPAGDGQEESHQAEGYQR